MRSHLAKWEGQRFVFTALFIEYSRTPQGRNVALLRDIQIQGITIADHIWIHRSRVMKQLELWRWDKIEFEGEIRAYKHNKRDIECDYGIERIKGLKKL